MNSVLNTIHQLTTEVWQPEKIAFKIGNIEVAWYGIILTIGFVVAIILTTIKLACWYKIPYDPFLYYCMIGIPVSILGARTWSFIIGDAKVVNNFFIDFWDFKEGGLAIQGSVVACVIAAVIFFPLILKKPSFQVKTMDGDGNQYVRQISTWVYADAIVPCVLIGQVIGRWGNFTNQELYGATVSNLDWLKVVMPKVVEGMYINGSYRQPLFLYESFFNFFIFIGLYVGGEFIKVRKAGDLAICYFIFYGIVRLCMEPFRDSKFSFLTSIVTSIVYIVLGIIFIILNHFVFSRNRDKNILYTINWFFKYYFWLNIKFYCYEKFKKIQTISQDDIKKICDSKKDKFIRSKEEMLYYNGY